MITLRATIYLDFPDDIEGDDPLREVYTPYDAERDIETVLGQRYPNGLRHVTTRIEVMDAEYTTREDA
jgi:hypothetical protein